MFGAQLPRWLVVSDWDTVNAFYMGGRSFYRSGLEWQWLRPFFGWAGLLMLLFLIQVDLTLIAAERWTVRERLSYPIVRPPLELTREGTPPFLRPPVWYGCAIAGLVDLVNGLWYLYPSLPHFPVREIDLLQSFPGPPLNAMGSTLVRFHPFIVGMGFLMPADVLNSCWLSFVFGKVQRVLGRMVGWSAVPRFPFQGEQAAGAMLAVVVMTLWIMRGYLRGVWAAARGRRHRPARGGLGGQYRAALAVIAVGLVALVALSGATGMSPGTMGAFFLLYFIISVGVTRIRAEAGPPSHSMLFVNPQDVLIVWRGTRGPASRT